MDIFEKLKELGLSEEDLNGLKSSIKTQVTEAVEARVAKETDKIRIGKDEEYNTKLAEETEVIRESLTKEYDQKMVELEEKLVDALDQFLDSEISESISDKMLEKIAINETLVPLFADMRKLFEEKYIEMDTEGTAILRAAKEEIETLQDQISESINEKMNVKKELENTQAKLIIAQKTTGLTENQTDRVEKFLSGKSLAEVQKTIDNLVEVVTKDSKSDKGSENLHENVDPVIQEDKDKKETKPTKNIITDDLLKSVEKVMV